jgi:lysophospholipase L1-like esterase
VSDSGRFFRVFISRLLLVIAVLILADLAIRAIFANEVSTRRLRAREDTSVVAEFTRPSRDPGLVFELRPATDVRWAGVRVVTDSDGYARISAGRKAVERPDVKIALLGDSTSFGWRVEYEDTYGEALRRMLEARSGRSVEVRNFSVPGYNSHHERVCLQNRVLPWKPDLVILHYDFNDADPIDTKPADYLAPEYGDNPLHSALVKLVVRRMRLIQLRRMTTAVAEEPGNPEKFLHGYRISGPQYDRHLRELESLSESARALNIPVVAFIFDTWLSRQADPEKDPLYIFLHKPIAEKMKGWGYSVVDSYLHYQSLMADRGWEDLSPLWVDRSDGHPNPEGHAFIAQMLFDHLMSSGLWSQILERPPSRKKIPD